MWQHRFRAHRVQELVGLVGALVQGRAAVFREPYRLRPRHPGGRRRLPDAADPLVVRVAPPAADILAAPDPRLPQPVRDRRPPLMRAIKVAGVVPVEILAAADVAAQIGGIVDPPEPGVQVRFPIPPVRQGQVVVDPHEVDVRVRPKRVEMEPHLPVARVVAEILAPVGGIAQLDAWADNRAHVRRQRLQRGDRRVAAARTPDLRQTDHLGPDQERIDPARHRAQMRVVQDEPAIGPAVRPRIDDLAVAHGEIATRRGAEERRDLGLGPRGQDVARLAGDPPAPRHDRLLALAGQRVRAAVALQLLHQDERIEHRAPPARRDRPQRLDHRPVRRRAAIDRPPVGPRHHVRARPVNPARAPGHLGPVAFLLLDLGAQGAAPGAQVVPEPRHHKRHRPHLRQLAPQRVQRHLHVGAAGGGVAVDDLRLAQAQVVAHLRRGQRIFPRAGDHRHRLHVAGQAAVGVGRARHLEAQLRDAVAPAFKAKLLQHDIGDAAIGGGVLALVRDDAGIGQLRLAAAIDAHVQLVRRDLLTVGPDPPHAQDRPLAQRDRHAQAIAHLGDARAPGALAAARAARHLRHRRGPDHVARHAHLPPEAGDRSALARSLQAQPIDPAGLYRAGARAQQALVDDAAQRRAHGAADHGARQAKDGPPEPRPDRCARRRQQNRRHRHPPSDRTASAAPAGGPVLMRPETRTAPRPAPATARTAGSRRRRGGHSHG